MAKLGKDKIALFLACTSVLGGKTQAMNISKVQSPQTIGAVRGARTQPKKINWGKIAKIGGFTVAGLAALETIHSLIGGFTDYKIGSYSIGRAIRNRVKKNEQPDSGKLEKLNSDYGNNELGENKSFEKNDDKTLHANFKKNKAQMERDAEDNIKCIKEKIAKLASDQFEDMNNGLDSKKIGQVIDRLKKQMLDYQNINIIAACDHEQKIYYGEVGKNKTFSYPIKLLNNENKKEFIDIIKIFSGVFTGELSLNNEEVEFRNFCGQTIYIKKEGKEYRMFFDVYKDNILHFYEVVDGTTKRYIQCIY